MARPERNTVDYFPHILGEGKKMFFIENKYGNDGYATWYKILEKLGSSDHHYLNLNREDELMFLAAKCKVSEETLLSIISDLVKIGAFDKEMWANKIVWCDQFIESISDAYVKRKNKCIDIDSLRLLLISLGVLKPSKLPLKGDVKPQRKEEDIKEEDIKLNNTIPTELIFHFYSIEFMATWDILRNSKKWKKKSFAALQSSLKQIGEFANGNEITGIKIMEASIAGEYQGVFPLKNGSGSSQLTPKDGKLTQAAKFLAEEDERLKIKYNKS